MPLSFKLGRPNKRGICLIKCYYARTLDGIRYPEKSWTATFKNGKKLQVHESDWVGYNKTKTKRKQQYNRVNINNEFAALINERLDAIERAAQIIEHRIEKDNIVCTPETFKKYWDVQFSETPVIDVYKKYMEYQSKRTSQHNIAVLQNVLNKLMLFPNLKFRDFNKEFPDKFSTRSTLSPGSLRSYLSRVRAFLSWSTKENYHKNLFYQTWDMPEQSQREFALEWWQVKRIRDAKISHPITTWARDYFMLLFYTGTRRNEPTTLIEYTGQSDFVRLLKYKVSKQKKETWIDFEPSPEVLEIWDRYKDNIFPYSPNTLKSHLRKVGEIAGLTEDVIRQLTPHVARHTFVTLASSVGFNMEAIMEQTGQTEKVAVRYNHSTSVSSISRKLSDKLKKLG